MAYGIGIDVGGTFTDAVILDDEQSVVAAAKSPTRADRALGVGQAIDHVLGQAQLEGSDIALVSLATTLATNALVEGQGGPVGLVFVGFDQSELERDGLREALAGGPVIFADGGHDSQGNERHPLDVGPVAEAAAELAVDAFAVASRFSVRNPAHELAVREALSGLAKPITCSHELSASLGGPRRALTCVLNAGLTGLINELCRATRGILDARSIDAPLLIVRGDGSLMSEVVAAERPIETILSGPAASLAGAAHLSGQTNIVAADIGGTTTDVGIVRNGRPKVSGDGATVGGHQTMVEAVDVRTTGLGGDSLVELELRADPTGLLIGPRRVVPVSSLAAEHPDLVKKALRDLQLPYRIGHVHFVRVADEGTRRLSAGPREQAILDRVAQSPFGGWAPLGEAAPSSLERRLTEGLVADGSLLLAGFTPTDATLVLGLHNIGDAEAARLAADVLASASDSAGEPVRPDGESLARWVAEQVARRSAEAVLDATLSADGLDETISGPLAQAALDRRAVAPSDPPATALDIMPSMPLVGLGAGAGTYHPRAAALLGVEAIVPEHSPVAGAVGAAIGGVRVTRRATITQPRRGSFRLHLPEAGADRGDLAPTIDRAVELLSAQASAEAERAGAIEVELAVDVEQRTADIQGKLYVVEATVTVTASGPASTSRRSG